MANQSPTPATPKRLGSLAQFADHDALIAAAGKTTDEGYRKVEAYSPFAVIGLDDALKQHGTILPWVVFCMGLTGSIVGISMQYYMNSAEGPWFLAGYDFAISGKPSFSVPANIPVMFESTILMSAFGAFFGMLLLNGLPRFHNPLHASERFLRATNDGFFLFVDAKDPKYASTETEAFLQSIGATAVESIDQPQKGWAVPGYLNLAAACVVSLACIPPLWLWASSSTTSSLPRISFFKDMETQAKYKPQSQSALFADNRASRPPIEGTIARGSMKDNVKRYYGVTDAGELAGSPSPLEARLVSYSQAGADGAAPAAPADGAAATPPALPEPDWVKDFPIPVTEQLAKRGEQRFNIYCATCHGLGGDGDGLVSKRAVSLEQGTWTLPSSVHIASVVEQPVGKLFNTVSNGVRSMPGYKQQISVEDRWAIVLHLRVLQKSRAATAEELPQEKLQELSNLK
ncbi:MAG: quinol:electron acceptor oxidoreductase subunit ActD [Lacipirellulaceae bacterium]